MRMLKGHSWVLASVALFALFLTISAAAGFAPGKAMGQNFLSFLAHMLKVLPCVFVLIGVFEVWVKTETVEKHLGAGAGPMSYLWAVLLAGTTVGGLHLALPVAHALHTKRAKLGVVLAFLSSSAVCRVPMTMFEASFLGWRFTCVRFAISLPLVIITSAALGVWCERRRYRLPDLDRPVRGDETGGSGLFSVSETADPNDGGDRYADGHGVAPGSSTAPETSPSAR